MQLQGLSASFDHEKSMSQQKIDSLEANLKETKNTLQWMQEIMNENVESQKTSFGAEKKELIERIETLQSWITEKEWELSLLVHNQESISSKAKSKDQELQDLKQEV